MARKKASGNFESAFDNELESIQTPEDSLESVSSGTIIESDTTDSIDTDVSQPVPTSQAGKFGLVNVGDPEAVETVYKTYKLNSFTAKKLDSLVHKDSKNTKKVPGTKGFLSDFLENAIWQHFLQLGLISEAEANEHMKDYSKYPINVENFKSIK
ncbi:hypothetical protein [Enterococcus pallens]|uniref:Uncharacterized protein n=1 Tax=Enterococcus pallens ATCC BAA-351 TaxID=1158607 RepID=R2PSL3_9ENTE|nr:hypothetical protein [Enterococcus pallens]EOH86298.1 hypothetical protein UAU_05220 [Enterococcus pallens ATCC BAA-351]EOU09481.1 hypothetical protein I588_05214 [Enterococcus pallens ATCC BAA-351]OJG77525.1 hypothetical protein RV10_GL002359 [Enterococcus pallens]